MRELINHMKGWPWWLKLIFSLPVIDGLVWGSFRIMNGYIILGVAWIILNPVVFIIDVMSIIIFKDIKILV